MPRWLLPTLAVISLALCLACCLVIFAASNSSKAGPGLIGSIQREYSLKAALLALLPAGLMVRAIIRAIRRETRAGRPNSEP